MKGACRESPLVVLIWLNLQCSLNIRHKRQRLRASTWLFRGQTFWRVDRHFINLSNLAIDMPHITNYHAILLFCFHFIHWNILESLTQIQLCDLYLSADVDNPIAWASLIYSSWDDDPFCLDDIFSEWMNAISFLGIFRVIHKGMMYMDISGCLPSVQSRSIWVHSTRSMARGTEEKYCVSGDRGVSKQVLGLNHKWLLMLCNGTFRKCWHAASISWPSATEHSVFDQLIAKNAMTAHQL